MKKIPTLFVRDPDDMSRVLPEIHPECGWVLAGEGVATRKYDGTCVALLGGVWWARREVKPGKAAPQGFMPIGTDPETGKTVGWEPSEQSPFAKFLTEALAQPGLHPEGTYELCGPRINGNPERFELHTLVRHADAERLGLTLVNDAPSHHAQGLAYAALRDLLTDLAREGWEGIVWHHPDGRMAKLKGRDFPKAAQS